MKTYGDLFTGFGGATIGVLAAGLRPLWGVEYRADVAAVANGNLGGHVRVADVLDCDPATFERVDVLHASPPCPNFSVAKAGAAETAHDLALAAKVAEFVTVLRPAAFTLENVMAYKDSQSWRIIEQALFDAGYWVHQDVCNSADFGVPQTRKRLIVRAVLCGFVPYLPAPVPWIGWYAAVADLLPGLPDSRLAPWQLARLPENLATAIAFGSNGNTEFWGDHHAVADEPMLAVTAQTLGRSRAVLVDSRNVNQQYGDGLRQQAEPATTAVVVDRPSHAPKAVLMAQGVYGDKLIMSEAEAPSGTITANSNQSGMRAIVASRVVSMSPRCLARFQSFPDWYVLPEKRTLAALGIGNAAPPLMMQRIFEGLVEVGS